MHDSELMDCESLEACFDSGAITKEAQLRARAIELISFVQGKVNANELQLPAIP